MYTHKVLTNDNGSTSATFVGIQPRTTQRLLIVGDAIPLTIKAGLSGSSSDNAVADRMVTIDNNWTGPGFLILEDLVADTLTIELNAPVPSTYALEIVLDSY